MAAWCVAVSARECAWAIAGVDAWGASGGGVKGDAGVRGSCCGVMGDVGVHGSCCCRTHAGVSSSSLCVAVAGDDDAAAAPSRKGKKCSMSVTWRDV
jgi:hypothetical protein